MFSRSIRITSALALGIAASLVVASAANATTIHDTSADDSNYINAWGGSGWSTPTYGQTVVAPAYDTTLDEFTFRIATEGGSGDTLFRAEVYAWDEVNHIATGPALWVSSTRTVPSGSPATTYDFTPHTKLHAGERYVLLGTTLADTQPVGLTSSSHWVAEADDSAIDGKMVWSNDSSGESGLTTNAWDGTGWDADLAMKIVWSGAPAPVVTKASAVSGSTQGGQKVVLTGTGFTDATSVTFGGTSAPFTVNSATQITTTAPKHVAGVVPIVVTTSNGRSTGFSYTYADPSLAAKKLSLALSAAQVVGGSHVTVSAKGLAAHEKYSISLAGAKTVSGSADATGAVKRSIVVPSSLKGVKSVRITGSTAQRTASANLRVLARHAKLAVTFAPRPIVEANRSLTITVRGLGSHEKVTVKLKTKTVSPKGATANAKGVYTLKFSAGWSWGYKIVTVTGAVSTRTGKAKIDVEARHNPQRVF